MEGFRSRIAPGLLRNLRGPSKGGSLPLFRPPYCVHSPAGPVEVRLEFVANQRLSPPVEPLQAQPLLLATVQ